MKQLDLFAKAKRAATRATETRARERDAQVREQRRRAAKGLALQEFRAKSWEWMHKPSASAGEER